MKNSAVIVLAAGRGARIKAKVKNKVVFSLGDKPMVVHTVANLKKAGVGQIIIVVGFKADSVRRVLGDKIDFAVQDSPQGTGDAVKVGLTKLKDEIETVFIVNGDDSAFYTPELYLEMFKKLKLEETDAVLLTIKKENPTNLGRIIRNDQGSIKRIVEERVATEKEKRIKEINTNLYCVKRKFLEKTIGQIKRNPVSQEYYLTDIVEIADQFGQKISPMILEDKNLWHGVNTRQELESARRKYDQLQGK